MKGVVTVILLAFVVVSVVYMAVGQRGYGNVAVTKAEVAETAATEPTQGIADDDAGMRDGADHVEGRAAVASATSEAVATPQEATKASRRVIAYYFHRTQRCRTCLTMEAYAEDAIREGLLDAFETGEVEWRALNVEEPQHEHFVQEYGLTASALVMVLLENGKQEKWKDLGRVWELVGDEWEFKEYVRHEALAYWESGS
ncbi:MAG: nitrophenyl compound nitroreductase subunit ArsF family protein [Planctomycetota bacterium]|jgi:hypothetical protein